VKKSGTRSEATAAALIDATLQIVQESGVKSVTHRKVCSYAGVALGGSTYHYETLDSLILDAFAHYVETIAESYEDRLAGAQSDADLIDALLHLIAFVTDDARNAMLQWELLAEAGRQDEYLELAQRWSVRVRAAVEVYVSSETAHLLEVIWDGAVIQRVLNDKQLGDDKLRELIGAALEFDPARGYPRQVAEAHTSPKPRSTPATRKASPRRRGSKAS
jgi:DNA-binding transcriptional regulator YbjK